MRIAVISNVAPHATGGAGQIAARYTKLLRGRGHDVRMWGPDTAFERLASMHPLQRLRFHIRDVSARMTSVQEIVAWKPDVLLTHNLTGCGFGSPQHIQREGVRWVHLLHDVQLIDPSGQIVEGESFRLARSAWRIAWSMVRIAAMGHPDAVISPTQWLLDFHTGYGWFEKSSRAIIPNPLSSDPAADRAASPERMRHTNSGRTSQTCIYVGRVDYDKGIDLLLEAWKQRKAVDAKLIIVGDGHWRARIAALNDPTIDFRGTLPNEDVLSLFAQCSICVVPSRVWENQPTVVLEALSAGCRVVAADVGGVRETLGGAGWIVAPDSIEALVEGMYRASVAAEDLKRQRAVQHIIEAHDPVRVVDALEAVLKSNL